MDFNAALNNFLATVNKGHEKVNAEMAKGWPEGYYQPVTVDEGKRYLRVVMTSSGQRSVYCFVEKGTGNVLKAAGWKAPAKGVRANIFNAETISAAGKQSGSGWLYAR